MPQDGFRAADIGWQREANCDGALFEFIPDVETPDALEAVRGAWCNPCTVRTECLAYALLYRMPGYWGGTDTAERRLLGYARERVKCPVCKSKALVTTPEGHEVCQACGMSWRSSSDPREEDLSPRRQPDEPDRDRTERARPVATSRPFAQAP